ncbi:DUF3336 domain-containing protein [Spongiibacter sp. KMU-166]|uniref:DUF3336 domain-containing protein n=1 Tax=Spongiibacter thalassae TaxID=2721624 RepID=A0ABX1G9L6_9GAMM|nr:DUF3336 domain-containing protein [Spongiibacter thalassae]NKI15850.1 DUF3336 domain-containing protein [Spongiibacter thalassae]
MPKSSSDQTAISSYTEWLSWAEQHDANSGLSAWRAEENSDLYDYKAIKTRLNRLHTLRESGNARGLLFALHEGIHGNMGGMGKLPLYNKAKTGTKHLIDKYIDEIIMSIQAIDNTPETQISYEEKKAFFNRANQCYGRSALMLSGGGTLGYFHYGVVKALAEQKLLPKIISGSSAGSITAGMLGTHTDAELYKLFSPTHLAEDAEYEVSFLDSIFRFRSNSVSLEYLLALIARLIPDMTFEEAYEKTGRYINISVAPAELHQTSRLLNAITTPNVLIRSAVQASCTVPGVFPPVVLKAKNFNGELQDYLPSRKWVDGSVTDDLPTKRLARLYGVNHYIVSLINPLTRPFLANPDDNEVVSLLFKPMKSFLTESLRSAVKLRTHLAFPLPKSATAAVDVLYSVFEQSYDADIKIIPEKLLIPALRLLSKPSVKEVLTLMEAGEKSTWPKIPRIHSNTRISRLMDTILPKYGL